MSLSDDLARLTYVVTAAHVRSGTARQLHAETPLPTSEVAKACGTTAETVESWLDGTSVPTTGQALAWFDTLYRSLPRSTP